MSECRDRVRQVPHIDAFYCLFLIPVAMLVGCGHDGRLGRVHGTVRLDGRPVPSGTVRFVPDAGRGANGKIESDGTYALGTFGQSDGALLGPHKVAIVAYENGGEERPAYELRNQKMKPLVPEKYMSPGTSGLTFEVAPGDNQADFELKSGR
jgi:hypothetical protein